MNSLKTRWPSMASTLLALALLVGASNSHAGVFTLLTDYEHSEVGTCHIEIWDRYIPIDWGNMLEPHCRLKRAKWFVITNQPSATTVHFMAYKSGECWSPKEIIYDIAVKTRNEYSTDPDRPVDLLSLLQGAVKGKAADKDLQIVQADRSSDVGADFNYFNALRCIKMEISQ